VLIVQQRGILWRAIGRVLCGSREILESRSGILSAACSITSERAKGFNHQPKILPQVKPCLGMAL
jgi:hypothetical protein